MFPVKVYKQELVGMFFHSFHRDGARNWQGKVISQSGEEITVQLFSWLTGQATDIEYLDINQLECFVFYDYEGDWIEQGDKSSLSKEMIAEGKRILSL